MRWIDPAAKENVNIALKAIRSQLLRTIITVATIAFGIMALVAIKTFVGALEGSINTEFSRMGSNTFSVFAKNSRSQGGRQGVQDKLYEPFDYNEANDFKEQFEFDATVGISAFGSGTAIVKYKSEKTNPNIRVIGADEAYVTISGYDLDQGRAFSEKEIEMGSNVVILGSDVVNTVFSDTENPMDKVVSIGNYKYTVVGILKSKGSGLGISNDNQCIIPVSNVRKNFASSSTEYSISVLVDNPDELEGAISEASGLLRIVRGDGFGEESFEIEKSDSMAAMVTDLIGPVSTGASLIGFITLIGAGIALMNIMLVSVTERTREIGVRKAIGASSQKIRRQFLMEAIVIGQMGGVLGTVGGIVIGFLLSTLLSIPFVIPWFWIITGVMLCLIVSVVSGYYPANRASKMDPIESLRYE